MQEGNLSTSPQSISSLYFLLFFYPFIADFLKNYPSSLVAVIPTVVDVMSELTQCTTKYHIVCVFNHFFIEHFLINTNRNCFEVVEALVECRSDFFISLARI